MAPVGTLISEPDPVTDVTDVKRSTSPSVT